MAGETSSTSQEVFDEATRMFYCHTLTALLEAGVPFLVGGAYALQRYTGVERHTKDLDVFVREADCQEALDVLAAAGYRTDLTFPHWLGKAYCGDDCVDIIFGSGNGIAPVDDAWFHHAVDEEVLGLPIKIAPPEEVLWSKAFIMERERYDGADVAHLLRSYGRDLDWPRLIGRFDENWPVLLSHLVLFGFIYPSHRDAVPAWVLDELIGRLRHSTPTDGAACRGTLLSRAQYLVDIQEWGYRDGRLTPDGNMTRQDVTHWTAAIDQQH